MSVSARTVTVDDVIRWDGQTWTVLGLNPTRMHLRCRETRDFLWVNADAVLLADDFEVLRSSAPDPYENSRPDHPLDGVPQDAADAARALDAELTRLLAGIDDDTPSNEVAEEYRGLGLKQRCRVLAQRLDAGERTVNRWVSRKREFGVAGLVNEKRLNLTGNAANIPPEVRGAILHVLDETKDASRLTKSEIGRRVRRLLDAQRMADKFPPRRTFDRYIDVLTAGLPRHLTMASQRSARNRPVGQVPWLVVSRPLESVMLDTTPLDLFALNPFAEGKESKWQRVWLTLAVDVFSRSIVGWVFTFGEPVSEDICLLLYRIVAPKRTQPHWPADAAWRYPGVPVSLVFEAAHEVTVGDSDVAGVPFGCAETFVVDHGKVYLAEATREAARLLGSNLQLARVRTPTDKPHVEAAFDRVREQFVMPLPGYKGPDVASRGTREQVENTAFLFLWEIEDYFAEWVACDYQRSTHRGLTFQSCPDVELTPNEAYEFGITRSGLLPVPPPQDLRIELLPTMWRTVQHYGVEFRGIRYDADVLNAYRNKTSPWAGQKARWKFKYDRSDRSRIWFWAVEHNDPADGSWQPLFYRGWQDAPVFGDEEIAYAKSVILGRGGDTRNSQQIEDTLDRIILRIHEQQALPTSERQMAGRTLLRAAVIRTDSASTAGEAIPDGGVGPKATPAAVEKPLARPTVQEDRTGQEDDTVDGGQRGLRLLDGPEEVIDDAFAGLVALDNDGTNGGHEDLSVEDGHR